MQSMNNSGKQINRQAILTEVNDIVNFVETAYREQQPVHAVEYGLWKRMLQLGWHLLSAFFGLYGTGDEGQVLELGDGRQVKRLPETQTRPYQSVFGAFDLTRTVYGTRQGQKVEAVPFDQHLQLPESKFSYLLQDWNQALEVEMPFAQVSATLERILDFKQSVHSLERSQREASRELEAFWKMQPIPPLEKEGELLVYTGDGKGVPMRGAGVQSCLGAGQQEKGMRTGCKKIALLGAVYTIDAFVRTPQEVIEALFRQPRPRSSRLPLNGPSRASSACALACNAMRLIRPMHRPTAFSHGWPMRSHSVIRTSKNRSLC